MTTKSTRHLSRPPIQHTRQPSMRSPLATGRNTRRNLVSTSMAPMNCSLVGGTVKAGWGAEYREGVGCRYGTASGFQRFRKPLTFGMPILTADLNSVAWLLISRPWPNARRAALETCCQIGISFTIRANTPRPRCAVATHATTCLARVQIARRQLRPVPSR